MDEVIDITAVNGINGSTGGYLGEGVTAERLASLARGERYTGEEEGLYRAKEAAGLANLGLPFGVDPGDLAQTGWGVIFASDAAPGLRERLTPLLDRRRAQAGARYRELTHLPGESAARFLERHQVGPGTPDPARVPYFLLIVGAPGRIPFRFQTDLDLSYGVGRLDFDALDEYRAYAGNVVEAEGAPPKPARRALLLGTSNADDVATAMSRELLVTPLARELSGPGWTVECPPVAAATKESLVKLLQSPRPPELLFTASHGVAFRPDDPRLASAQGALLCQDWPGPRNHRGAIPADWYLSGRDVGADTDLRGTIAFFFACFSAGTPRLDDYAPRSGAPAVLAPASMVAPLPKRLLSVPRGALAVVGHVERAWSHSFAWAGARAYHDVFRSALAALMAGTRVGWAMEFFASRQAEHAVQLIALLEELRHGAPADDLRLARLWTASNDARNYLVLGDPAVRLG